MKRILKTAAFSASALLATLAPINASAYNCATPDCDCYCDPCDFSGITIGVDWLFWKPCYDDHEFAYVRCVEGVQETFDYQCVKADAESGFRLSLAKPNIYCGWTLSGSYSWLNSKNKRTINTLGTFTTDIGLQSPLIAGEIISNTTTFAAPADALGDQAIGAFDVAYQTFDILLSAEVLHCNPCHHLIPYFGFNGLFLNQDYSVTVNGLNSVSGGNVITIESAWKEDTFAFGLKVGSEYSYNIADCYRIFSDFSAALLVSDDSGTSTQTLLNADGTTVSQFVYQDDTCSLFIPGYHLKLGAAYDSCWCGTDFSVHVGYELVQWHNIQAPRVWPGNNLSGQTALSTSPSVATIGYHGIFAGLDLTF